MRAWLQHFIPLRDVPCHFHFIVSYNHQIEQIKHAWHFTWSRDCGTALSYSSMRLKARYKNTAQTERWIDEWTGAWYGRVDYVPVTRYAKQIEIDEYACAIIEHNFQPFVSYTIYQVALLWTVNCCVHNYPGSLHDHWSMPDLTIIHHVMMRTRYSIRKKQQQQTSH